MDLHHLTAHEASDLLKKRQVSAEELTRAVLERGDVTEPAVGAYLTRTGEQALERAREIDRQRAAGAGLGPLAGVPVALKDNLCTEGVRTTCASKILENFIPPYTATAVRRLLDAGMVPLGKTNMDEFAMGSSCENSALQQTYNPWDRSRVPGGSSGGSAAAVAAGSATVALGSDTGGSIRQPAAFSGITGLKPTYGRISRYGLVAYASSLDQIGPMARDARDCALLLNALCGNDPCDATSANIPAPDFTAALSGDVRGLRAGVPKEYFGAGLAPGVRAAIEAAIAQLRAMGAEVGECSLPSTDYALSAYYIIAPAEASSNLARYDGVRYGYRAAGAKELIEMYSRTRAEGFGAEVKRRIMLGTYALSSGYYDAYYLKAQKVRTLIRQEFDRAFERFDLIVAPTAPTVAYKVGEKTADPMEMYLGDVCTVPINLAGLPAISVPCGFDGGLPVGLQIVGKPFDEATVLRAADAYQQATDFHRQRPAL